jgi:MFS family permease
MVLNFAQQSSGVNITIFYSTSIFKDAGISNSNVATAVNGLAKVLSTLFGVYLMNRYGRRTLLLIGEVLNLVSLIALAISFIFKGSPQMPYLSVISILVFTFGFAIGIGPIPFLLMGEIFPNEARSTATSLATCANWVSSFVTALTFPLILFHVKQYTFFVYAGLMIIYIIFSYIFVFETKDKSVENIQKYLKGEIKEL